MRKLNKKGFTLMELLITVALLSIIMLVAQRFINQLLHVKQNSEVAMANQINRSIIIDTIQSDLITNGRGCIVEATQNCVLFTYAGNHVELELIGIDSSATIRLSTEQLIYTSFTGKRYEWAFENARSSISSDRNKYVRETRLANSRIIQITIPIYIQGALGTDNRNHINDIVISYVYSNTIPERPYRILRDAIIADHGGIPAIEARGIPNFNEVVLNATPLNGGGLFVTNDEEGISYYFRGTHTGNNAVNNNIIFAGHQWKILRIEGNGNIRLIYNGECPDNDCIINGALAGENASIVRVDDGSRTGAFNTQYNYNRFVGYMFGSEEGDFDEQHANTYPSTIKGIVEAWFEYHFPDDSDQRELVADNTRFCIDRSLASEASHVAAGYGSEQGTGLGESITSFGSIDRVWSFFLGTGNNQPRLTCPREEDKLELPIGLITADEVSMAGGMGLNANNYFFLRSNQWFWTMSPSVFRNYTAHMIGVNTDGNLSDTNVFGNHGIRPVIAIQGNIPVTGDGSLANPFVVIEPDND